MGVLDGKVAIVTGSARGIGRATAELLSEHGAKVLVNDLDADLAQHHVRPPLLAGIPKPQQARGRVQTAEDLADHDLLALLVGELGNARPHLLKLLRGRVIELPELIAGLPNGAGEVVRARGEHLVARAQPGVGEWAERVEMPHAASRGDQDAHARNLPPRSACGPRTSNSPPTQTDRQGSGHVGVLDGKAAIVTGSARGIGRTTAELLAEQGAKVLINDLDGDVAEEASKEIDGETRSTPAI